MCGPSSIVDPTLTSLNGKDGRWSQQKKQANVRPLNLCRVHAHCKGVTGIYGKLRLNLFTSRWQNFGGQLN